MTKSIYVIGPSSTGKTTLCDILCQKLNLQGPAYVKEVARQVMKSKGYTRNDVGFLQMQADIMEEHLKQEEQGLQCSPSILCDRSAIDPLVYARFTSPDKDEASRRHHHLISSSAFQNAHNRYQLQDSIFLLLSPVDDWLVDDGVRSIENQQQCFQIYREILDELEIPYREMDAHMRFLMERMVFTMGLLGH